MKNQVSSLSHRILFVDVAKVIGLLLIILSHCAHSGLGAKVTSFTNLVFVPIFFICSGYTTVHSISLTDKARKLLLPYFTMSSLYILAALLTNHRIGLLSLLGVIYSRFSLYPLGSAENVFFLNIHNGPTWFLTALFTSFLMFKWILAAPKEWQRLVICLIYLTVSKLLTSIPILLPWSIDTSFFFATLMYSGTLIRRFNVMDRPWWMFIILIAIYYICLRITDGINLSVRIYGNSLPLSFIGAICGSIVLLKISRYIAKAPFSSWLGTVNREALAIFGLQGLFMFLGKIALAQCLVCFPASRLLQSHYTMETVQIIFCFTFGWIAGYLLDRFFPMAMGRKAPHSSRP